jgi:hypothetical protein
MKLPPKENFLGFYNAPNLRSKWCYSTKSYGNENPKFSREIPLIQRSSENLKS